LDKGKGLSNWRIQGSRFVIVGLASNLVLYLLYLLMTWLGLGYKIAMTLVYVTGTIQTFVLNSRWTFERMGTRASMVKYAVAYGACYLINMLALIVLVDGIGLPHQIVQGVMILVIAVFMFLLQKFWVFGPPST
jgi:putative flippase GtrA